MTATSTRGPTGNPYIDGVLTGLRWAATSLTYSFPARAVDYGAGYAGGEPGSDFKAFTPVQQVAARRILAMDSAVAAVAFTKVTESPTAHGTIRYAESDKRGTSWAYYPSANAAGGDVWLNNASHWYDSPAKGTYAGMALLHETGHAMGLKHPQDVIGAFRAMPVNHDSLEYSVMSYRSYVGASLTGGYTNAATSYPQTLMMYDIAALQASYGANYNSQRVDSVYKWSRSTGQEFINGVGQAAPAGNKIFMTLWDGGGNDTYDFSNYATSLKVDLAPGAWTTVAAGQLASLGNGHVAAGNIANALLYHGSGASLIENAVGGTGNDVISGNAANNRLTGGRGNDLIDGRGGTNTAVYSGNAANYGRTANPDGSWKIVDHRPGSPDGTDTLRHIAVLQFADRQVVLAGTTARTIATANQAPAPAYHDVGWVDPFHTDSLASLDWPAPLHDTGLAGFGWPDPLNGHAGDGLLFA